ncbi:MAG: outer rane adhesin like protein [Bacteroidetes bacterium]|nr:outer rane adhesin like protein [Bacteroidota bacterium]
MKRTLTLLFLSLCTLLTTHAQITLVTGDMPTVGWVNVMQKDTLSGAINYGSRGTSQVYDFSTFHNDKPDSLFYLTPTSAQTSAVPNAQIAITGDHSTYIFAKNTPAHFDYVGGQVVYSGTTLLTPFSPIDTGFKFTTAYGQNFRGTYGFTTSQPGSTFGQPTVYMVRITNTTTYTDSIDGWGTVKTPVGTYNCVRQHRVEHSSTLLEYSLCSFCGYSNVPTGAGLPNNPIVSVTNTYGYLAKETHGSVISFAYDSVGNPKTASWSTTPPTPKAKFGYTLNPSGAVAFHDSSTGTPLTYSWSFGDASAGSTTQNPNHTYTANGTYYVCLTVTNISGSNTFCDSVHITNIVAASIPPNATNDVATVTQPGTVNIAPLTNDVNHNPGDSLCINSIWGAPAGWAVLQGCSTVVFHPTNSNFTGLDTFYYKVCDIHLPTLCDTAMVIVDVLPAPLAPTALDDTASVLQPGTVTVNASANDVGHNSGHTLCITSVWGAPTGWTTLQGCNNIVFHALDSSFMGLDTFYYKICDQQLPTLCDTGMVVVNVMMQVTIQPVIGYVYTPGNCHFSLSDTSQYADSTVYRLVLVGGLDTVLHNPSGYTPPPGALAGSLSICITAYNAGVMVSRCDTVQVGCVGIVEIPTTAIGIYPNPASDQIQLDLSHVDQATMSELTAIEVYNILGDKLKAISIKTNTTINVSDLSNGVYMIGVLDKNNTRRVLGKFEVVR